MAQVMTVKKVVLRGCDAQKNVLTVLQTLLSQCTLRENVFWGRSASIDIVITWFGDYKKLASNTRWLQTVGLFSISVASLMEVRH